MDVYPWIWPSNVHDHIYESVELVNISLYILLLVYQNVKTVSNVYTIYYTDLKIKENRNHTKKNHKNPHTHSKNLRLLQNYHDHMLERMKIWKRGSHGFSVHNQIVLTCFSVSWWMWWSKENSDCINSLCIDICFYFLHFVVWSKSRGLLTRYNTLNYKSGDDPLIFCHVNC